MVNRCFNQLKIRQQQHLSSGWMEQNLKDTFKTLSFAIVDALRMSRL